MNGSWKRWILIGVLLSVTALTAWISLLMDERTSLADRQQRNLPDSYMENFTRTAMDEHGQVRSKLKAVNMVHYPHDDSLVLKKPSLEYVSDEKQPWYAIAEKGRLHSNNKIVSLYGKVHVWRIADDGEPDIEIVTTELRIYTETEYLETDRAVKIFNRTTTIDSVGARADMPNRRIELLGEVKARHEVKPQT